MSKIKKQERCNDALKILVKGGCCVFLTLTTKDVVDLQTIRERWRRLRNWLNRSLDKPSYVMNYELHPGYLQKVVDNKDGSTSVLRSDGESHGWHIHAVYNRFIPLSRMYDTIQSFGFGRLDVRKVTSRGVADYLTKHALKAYRGLSRKEREKYPSLRLRLVNTSRDLPALKDYEFHGSILDKSREILKGYVEDCKADGRESQPLKWMARSTALAVAGYASFTDWGRLVQRCQSFSKNMILP